MSSYRLIGYADRAVADDDFRNDAVDGGEVGAGPSVTTLYVVRLRAGAEGDVATATVRWQDPGDGVTRETKRAVSVDETRARLASAAPAASGAPAMGRMTGVTCRMSSNRRRARS